MFSGLIAHLGEVVSIEPAQGGVRLGVASAETIAEGVAPKDSIAVDGVCLTVVRHDATTVWFDVVPETLARSTLGTLAPGARVNLEASLRLGDRIGGHLVYGHIDGTTRIIAKDVEGQGHRLVIETPPQLAPYVVEKGYVAVDGVSLTVAATRDGRFEIALIPETSDRTTLGRKNADARVNLEMDPIARYALAAAARYGATSATDELAWAYEI